MSESSSWQDNKNSTHPLSRNNSIPTENLNRICDNADRAVEHLAKTHQASCMVAAAIGVDFDYRFRMKAFIAKLPTKLVFI